MLNRNFRITQKWERIFPLSYCKAENLDIDHTRTSSFNVKLGNEHLCYVSISKYFEYNHGCHFELYEENGELTLIFCVQGRIQ